MTTITKGNKMTASDAIRQSIQTDQVVRVAGLTVGDFQAAWNEDTVGSPAWFDCEERPEGLFFYGWDWLTKADKTAWSVLVTPSEG